MLIVYKPGLSSHGAWWRRVDGYQQLRGMRSVSSPPNEAQLARRAGVVQDTSGGSDLGI